MHDGYAFSLETEKLNLFPIGKEEIKEINLHLTSQFWVFIIWKLLTKWYGVISDICKKWPRAEINIHFPAELDNTAI